MQIVLPKITIITGHYGSGKTNLAVNLALKLKAQKEEVILVDLDVVNPYFRTADFKELLTSEGIDVITPQYANTNLDLPALPSEIYSVFTSKKKIIFDVGGDDAGATALGRYSELFKSSDYQMFYVSNCYRYFEDAISEEEELISEIESASKLKISSIINNSNLGAITTLEDVKNSFNFVDELAKKLKMELKFDAVRADLADKLGDYNRKILPIEVFVKPLWDK